MKLLKIFFIITLITFSSFAQAEDSLEYLRCITGVAPATGKRAGCVFYTIAEARRSGSVLTDTITNNGTAGIWDSSLHTLRLQRLYISSTTSIDYITVELKFRESAAIYEEPTELSGELHTFQDGSEKTTSCTGSVWNDYGTIYRKGSETGGIDSASGAFTLNCAERYFKAVFELDQTVNLDEIGPFRGPMSYMLRRQIDVEAAPQLRLEVKKLKKRLKAKG